MNLSRYLEIRKTVLDHAKKVEDDKRESYTAGDANVLRNFLSDSEFVGTSQLQNCFTHCMKQVRGISSFVQHPEVKPSESLLSRAADLINYAVLMVANAEDSGRDTGIMKTPAYFETQLKELDESILKWMGNKPSTDWTDCPYPQPIGLDTSATGKLAQGAYDYNFGKGNEEPWKD